MSLDRARSNGWTAEAAYDYWKSRAERAEKEIWSHWLKRAERAEALADKLAEALRLLIDDGELIPARQVLAALAEWEEARRGT